LCEIGYTGPLCGACEISGGKKYSRLAKFCVECLDYAVNFVRVIFSFAGFFSFIGFLVYAAVRDARRIISEDQKISISINKFFSIYLKLLMNYIQVVSVISSMDLKWPIYARSFTEAQSNVGNAPSHIISIECLLLGEEKFKYE
jgi:hypothetical protein